MVGDQVFSRTPTFRNPDQNGRGSGKSPTIGKEKNGGFTFRNSYFSQGGQPTFLNPTVDVLCTKTFGIESKLSCKPIPPERLVALYGPTTTYQTHP